MIKKLRENKIFRIIKTILNVIVGILLASFLLVVCLQRFSGNKISIFNYRMFTVASGSMMPKYEVGDVLISKEINPNDIKIGDTISYLGNKGDFKNKVITHEVISIDTESDGKKAFHTKGTANIIEDPIVYEDQIYGKVIYRAVVLSSIYKLIGTKYGILIIAIPIMYIIGSEILGFLLDNEEKKRNKNS